jgi:hypothetical protein
MGSWCLLGNRACGIVADPTEADYVAKITAGRRGRKAPLSPARPRVCPWKQPPSGRLLRLNLTRSSSWTLAPCPFPA